MSKRGTAQLIATVLIIGTVIALSAIFITWGNVFIEKNIKQTERVSNIGLASINKIAMNLLEVSVSGVYTLTAKIENSGELPIAGLIARVTRIDGSVVVEEDIIARIDPFEVKAVDLNFDIPVNSAVNVEVIPKVDFSDFGGSDNEAVTIRSDGAEINAPEIRIVQLSDTQIMTNGDCGNGDPLGLGNNYGNIAPDGRTSCPGQFLEFVDGCEDLDNNNFPDDYATCPWLDANSESINWIAIPNAPRVVLQEAIPKINALNPDYVIASGDLIAVAENDDEDCRDNHRDSMRLFNNIMSGLTAPWFPVGAYAHDHVTVPPWSNCKGNYLDGLRDWAGNEQNLDITVEGDALNWYFVDGDNLFIGLSESISDSNRYDDVFVETILSAYAEDTDIKKVFITLHVPWECDDTYAGTTWRTRCRGLGGVDGDEPESEIPAVDTYKDEYEVIVLITGHTHANQWDNSIDWTPQPGDTDIYHVITGALMSYPSDFRVFDIREDSINIYMSSSVSEELDAVSLEILEDRRAIEPFDPDEEPRGTWPSETLYGEEWERNIFIDLSN